MKISYLPQKPSIQVTFWFEGHSNLNRGQWTRLLYLQHNIGIMILFNWKVWGERWNAEGQGCAEKSSSLPPRAQALTGPYRGLGKEDNSWALDCSAGAGGTCLSLAWYSTASWRGLTEEQGCHPLPWTACSHWSPRRSERDRAPLDTALLRSLSSPSSSRAADILLQSHSLTRPLKVVLCWCLLLRLTCVCLIGLFAQNVAMLTISVQDINEEPVFVNNAYSARIPNSVPYKYPVTTVQVEYPSVLFVRTEISWKIWISSTVELG